jgi:hypothetical protein
MLSKELISRFTFSFILILSFSTYSFTQSVEGDWYGKADIQGLALRLNLHVTKTAEGYTSTWDSPDQGAFGIPSTTTTFNFPDFAFTHAGAGLRYEGKVNPAYTEISGKIFQNGQEIEVVFGREQIKAAAGSLSDLKTKYNKQEVYITMRDGVKLFTSIYTPKDTTTVHPVLINRTPYNIEPGGPMNFNFFMCHSFERQPTGGHRLPGTGKWRDRSEENSAPFLAVGCIQPRAPHGGAPLPFPPLGNSLHAQDRSSRSGQIGNHLLCETWMVLRDQ